METIKIFKDLWIIDTIKLAAITFMSDGIFGVCIENIVFVTNFKSIIRFILFTLTAFVSQKASENLSWSKHWKSCARNGRPDARHSFSITTMLGHILRGQLKTIWKLPGEKFYLTRRIAQTLLRLTTTCSGWCRMLLLEYASPNLKKSKIGSLRS